MNISKTTTRLAIALLAAGLSGAPVTACSSDEHPSNDGGTGGSETGGSGGKATGGSAGKGSGGQATGGNGGKATGGAGGKAHRDGGPGDAGCVSPQVLIYDKPGCNGSVAPVCAGPAFDACYIDACSCDGETIGGCGYYEKPYAHLGACVDSGRPDAGDGGGDAGSRHRDGG